jgi:membrane protein
VKGFIADEALSRAAAIAYFSLFSLAPLLVIAIAVAGLVFGDEAASGAISDQLRGLLGPDAAEAIQAIVQNARNEDSSVFAGALGLGSLLFAASGTFGELQSSLNAIWKTEAPTQGGISRLVRAKLAAFGLVATTAFLLLVSLMASAGIAALGNWITGLLPGCELLVRGAYIVVSLLLLTGLFAAIYKVLPDRILTWRDVLVGASATAVLFTIGKTAIGLYIGNAGIASSYGAAGSIVVLLVWIYYSSLIFLLGAEFTRAWAGLRGSHEAAPVPAEPVPQHARMAPPRDGISILALVATVWVLAVAVEGIRRRFERA